MFCELFRKSSPISSSSPARCAATVARNRSSFLPTSQGSRPRAPIRKYEKAASCNCGGHHWVSVQSGLEAYKRTLLALGPRLFYSVASKRSAISAACWNTLPRTSQNYQGQQAAIKAAQPGFSTHLGAAFHRAAVHLSPRPQANLSNRESSHLLPPSASYIHFSFSVCFPRKKKNKTRLFPCPTLKTT